MKIDDNSAIKTSEIKSNVDCMNENAKDSIDLSKFNSCHTNYVKQFNSFARKTAESALEMCRIVSMAKATLPKADFLKFCNEIGQKATDSTIRKYLAIGCAYDKFIEYADKLPNSWTTLYLITQIPADIFSELIKGNESLTNLRGAQIKRMISIGSGSNCNDENSLVYISAGNEIGSDAQATNQISPDSSNNLSDIDVNQKSSGIDKSISAIHSTAGQCPVLP